MTIPSDPTGPDPAGGVLGAPTDSEVACLDAWWRANNYLHRRPDLPHGQPAAARAADDADIKPRLLGHWGTSPGFVHLRPRLAA